VDDILRFPTALKHEPAIDAWLRAQRDELRPLVQAWFQRLRACGDDVRELMHDGCPTACVGDAAFAHVGAYTKHANVYFFFGAQLSDPAGLLEGTGKRGRHVKRQAREAQARMRGRRSGARCARGVGLRRHTRSTSRTVITRRG
jgi:hypothetical protein